MSRTHKKFTRSILSKILFLIRENTNQLSITERYDTYNFLFELNCTPFFGQNIAKALRLFRFHYLGNELNESYPRLFNSFAGDEARKYLLKKYWQFDWYTTSPPLSIQ